MFRWLLPKEALFFDFFEQHASVIVLASLEMLKLVSEKELDLTHIKRITELEHEADEITHRCKEALHKTFITPFERDDIFRLISRMDDIVDHVEAAASNISIFRLVEMNKDIVEIVTILVKAALEVKEAVMGLRRLKNTPQMGESFITISHLENQGDEAVRKAIAKLFDRDQDVRNIIKWKEIYEDIENALDRCADVSNVIEGVILETE